MLNIQSLENEPSEICSRLSENCQKAGFLRPIRSKITLAKEKDRRKRNGEEEERRRGENKKQWFFILEIVFGGQKTV